MHVAYWMTLLRLLMQRQHNLCRPLLAREMCVPLMNTRAVFVTWQSKLILSLFMSLSYYCGYGSTVRFFFLADGGRGRGEATVGGCLLLSLI